MRERRFYLVSFFFFFWATVIIGRLIYLQLIRADFYKALAEGQQKILSEAQAKRGEIFFQTKSRDLIPLAISQNWPSLYILPKVIKDKEKFSETLSQILGREKKEILEKLEKNNSLFLLEKKLSIEKVKELQKINLPGIEIIKKSGRYYPQGKFSSQVIGFLNSQGEGQYGVEEYYQNILKGQVGHQEFKIAQGGYLLDFWEREKPIDGKNLILTIDYNLQLMSEKILEKGKEDLGFESGQIIIIDPNSGKILALAHFPNFDLNSFEKYARENNFEIFLNKTIQRLFEPGSVFKPITMAIVLEEKEITPQTTYFDSGSVQIRDKTIHNYGKKIWKKQTMTQVLEKSINTGAVFVQQKIPKGVFLRYLEEFGFFEPTNIDLAGEIFSENRELRKGNEVNLATASFGQGIEITPLQLIRAFGAIANGGKLLKPYLVEKIIGEKEEEIKVREGKNIISSQTSRQLTNMLVSVVENGFAKRAKIPGFFIAGKTGTAQIPFSSLGINKRGYSEKSWQSFIGYFPAFNPKFLILIKLDNPKTKTAEYSAVPLFQELAREVIDYYQLPPDYSSESYEKSLF